MPRIQYDLLPTGDDAKADEQRDKRIRHARLKRITFHVLVVLALMYAGYHGLRAFARSSSQFLRAKPCHGAQRNLSALPSHYTLPSGHKIPSVALGTAASAVRTCWAC